MSDPTHNAWSEIRAKAGPYPTGAYRFVQQGLAHTVELTHGADALEGPGDDESRHVSGQQLCLGLRDFAVEQYGRMARLVLERWGIRSTEDFGRIVFAMVEAGLMRTTEDDSLDDFRGVFEFDEGFLEDASA